MRKPIVGETLYSLNVGNAARRVPQVLTPVVVIKVGRKYFTVCERGREGDKWAHDQHYIENWREKTEYSEKSHLYETEQQWEEDKEATEIGKEIWRAFESGWNRRNMSIDTIRKIKSIMDAEKERTE